MDTQQQRAIRRATESVGHVGRPADWTERDYRRWLETLEANGYEVKPTKDEAKRLAAVEKGEG